MLQVQKKMCKTCIYKPNSNLDLKTLEDEVKDQWGNFTSYRICHYSKDACCAGFWKRYKNHFLLGRLAQILNLVKKVQIDILEK